MTGPDAEVRHGDVVVFRGPEDPGRDFIKRAVAAGGRVCFPGGHIEPGEEEHEAVVRECREELAAVVEPAECVHRSVTAWGTSLAWWTVQLADGELVPHPVEVDEILWLTLDEMLEEPTLLSGNREFLEAVIDGRVRL